MTVHLTGIRVFLASPNGLQDEREYFKEVVWQFNEERAIPLEHIFIPVMFEQILGGAEQAQRRIHKQIENCDYCITMFWNDLGSPPEEDSPEGSVSVTDGEYRKAEMLIEEGRMEEAVIFFKDISQYQLQDRGEKVQRLLEYKEQQQKTCSYKEFADKAGLKDLINRHLQGWLYAAIGADRVQRPPVDVLDYADDTSIAGGD